MSNIEFFIVVTTVTAFVVLLAYVNVRLTLLAGDIRRALRTSNAFDSFVKDLGYEQTVEKKKWVKKGGGK